MNDVELERIIKMYAQDCYSYRTTLNQVLDALESDFDKNYWVVDMLKTNIKNTLKNTSIPSETYNFDEEEIPF